MADNKPAFKIKRPGSLTRKVGGKPSENISKVKELAKKPGVTGAQARFFLNILRKKKKKKSLLK